jgi:hypothetical protein
MTTASSYLRFWKCLMVVPIGTALLTRPLLAGGPPSNLKLTVQVYNSASVAPGTLIAAEDEGARIFREMGIAVRWLNCPLTISEAAANPICIAPVPPSRIAVRITSEMPANLAESSLGVAFTETGIYVTIYYPRVEESAKEGIANHSQILGHAIAHEMGHMLLGPVPHSRFGIMRGAWTAEDLRSIAMGAFLFKPYQSVLIRQAAMRRMQGEKASAPALPLVGQY